jgi:hypothetical protein
MGECSGVREVICPLFYLILFSNIFMIMKNTIRKILREHFESYTLYHGTSSGRLENILTKPSTLFLTTDKEVAIYYSVKGGEDYFLEKEIEFENEYGVTPDEYFDTEENGELNMFKSLYPKNESPVVLVIKIPQHLIPNIKNFMGYKGNDFKVDPKYIVNVIHIDWNELDF